MSSCPTCGRAYRPSRRPLTCTVCGVATAISPCVVCRRLGYESPTLFEEVSNAAEAEGS
jgi:hypothetical protein